MTFLITEDKHANKVAQNMEYMSIYCILNVQQKSCQFQ